MPNLIDRYHQLIETWPNPICVDEGMRQWISMIDVGVISEASLPAIFAGLKRWKQSEQWKDKGMVHSVPRWLREKLWLDHPRPSLKAESTDYSNSRYDPSEGYRA